MMDSLTFIAELVKALAWPMSIVLMVFLLRHVLRDLLPSLRKLKYKEFEAEFSEELAKAELQAEQAKLPSPEQAVEIASSMSEPVNEKYKRLAEIAPRVAIMEAWRDVELALNAAATGWDFDNPQDDSSPNLSSVIARLTREGKLDPGEQDFLEYMRSLRNRAAHAHDIDLRSDQAYDYAVLASRITARIRSIKRNDS
jgi:Sec-independent protein translocase protein TatA